MTKFINTQNDNNTLGLYLKLGGQEFFAGNLTQLPRFNSSAQYDAVPLSGFITMFIETASSAVDAGMAPIANTIPGAQNFGNFGKGMGQVLNGAIGLTTSLAKVNGLELKEQAGILTRKYFKSTGYMTYQFNTRISPLSFGRLYNSLLEYIMPQGVGQKAADAMGKGLTEFLDPFGWLPTQSSIDGKDFTWKNMSMLKDMFQQTAKNAATGIQTSANDGAKTGEEFIKEIFKAAGGENLNLDTRVDSADAMGYTLFKLLADQKDIANLEAYARGPRGFDTKASSVNLASEDTIRKTSKVALINEFFSKTTKDEDPSLSTKAAIGMANITNNLATTVSSMSAYLSQILSTIIQVGLTAHPRQFEYNEISVHYGELPSNVLPKIVPWATPSSHILNMALKYALSSLYIQPSEELDMDGGPLFYDLGLTFETTQKPVLITEGAESDGFDYSMSDLFKARANRDRRDLPLEKYSQEYINKKGKKETRLISSEAEGITRDDFAKLVTHEGRVNKGMEAIGKLAGDLANVVIKPISTLGAVFGAGSTGTTELKYENGQWVPKGKQLNLAPISTDAQWDRAGALSSNMDIASQQIATNLGNFQQRAATYENFISTDFNSLSRDELGPRALAYRIGGTNNPLTAQRRDMLAKDLETLSSKESLFMDVGGRKVLTVKALNVVTSSFHAEATDNLTNQLQTIIDRKDPALAQTFMNKLNSRNGLGQTGTWQGLIKHSNDNDNLKKYLAQVDQLARTTK